MNSLDNITIEDIINDSNKKIENLSKVIIRWAKERHLLDKIGFEKSMLVFSLIHIIK